MPSNLTAGILFIELVATKRGLPVPEEFASFEFPEKSLHVVIGSESDNVMVFALSHNPLDVELPTPPGPVCENPNRGMSAIVKINICFMFFKLLPMTVL